MSKFPAAFLSYFTGNDFYDNVGRNAPATRISIELPAELVDWSSRKGDEPPYKPQPVDPSLIAEIQNAVMRKYGGKARNNINAFRQDRGFGNIGFVSRQTVLDGGVGMRWMSQFGNEYVDIRVSPEAVRKLLGEEGGDLCMLVYYRKGEINKFAAIPMNRIDNPSQRDVVVNKKSNLEFIYPEFWENLSCVQMKIADDTHVVATHIGIDKNGNASVSGPLNSGTSIYYYNSLNTILGGVKGPKTPPLNIFTPINWSKKTVYDAVGNKVVFEANNKITATANASWVNANVVRAVTNNGGLYSAPVIGVIGSWASGYFSASQASQWAAISAIPNVFLAYYFGGPGEANLNSDYKVGTVSSGSGSVSSPCYFNIYSNNGRLDSISLGSTTATANAAYDTTTAPSSSYSNSSSIFGISFEEELDPSGSYTTSGPVAIYPMHGYALGSSLSDHWLGWDEAGYSTGTAQTPFGRFTNATTPFPQVFAANGKTYVCKFLYFDYAAMANKGKIYKNRVEYGSKLIKAIGADNENDVFVILLDIKLDDINKLK